MSGVLPLIVAAASAGEPPAPAVPLNDVSIALPSLDGLRGVAVGYERFLPARRLGLGASVQLREAAVGDYTGVRAGVGAEVRWYFRTADPWLSIQPRGAMAGWFVGGRLDVAIDGTRDAVADRWLGTMLGIGATGLVGYRIAPWRGLEITPSLGLAWRHEIDVSGRLPSWSRGSVAAGLSVGWMF